VVAATSSNVGDLPDFAVLRYNRDGDLDPTFGSDGTVRTDIGSSSFDFALAVALQPNGKIVVGGTTAGATGDFALARYNEDGSLDSSFGSFGKVVTDLASSSTDAVLSVAIQPNGKILAAGVGIVGGDNDFTFARYESDGSLDPSFGSGGVVRIDLGSTSDNLKGVELLPNGKILAIGSTPAAGTFDFALTRLNADGSLDQRFGTDGKVFTDVSGGGDFAQGADVEPSGKIVVAGFTGCCVAGDFEVVRYNADGSLDTSFGSGGVVVTDLGSGTDTPSDLAVTQSGKTLVVGVSSASGSADLAVVRYDQDGSLDPSFGSAGIALTDFGSSNEAARVVALLPDGGIVVAGNHTSSESFDTDVVVARYLAR